MSLFSALRAWLVGPRAGDPYPEAIDPANEEAMLRVRRGMPPSSPAAARRLSLSDFPYLDERDDSPRAFAQRAGVSDIAPITATKEPPP